MSSDESASPQVRAISTAEQARAVGTIVLALGSDPMARWSMPDPETYLTHFPALVRAFAGNAFAEANVHAVADFAGVAV